MAAGAGDYTFFQQVNQPVVANIVLDGTAKTTTQAIAVRSADHQIYIQKIILSITTHVAAKVFTVQDTAGTPLVIANRADLAAAAGVPDCVTWDFGSQGYPLTIGKSCNYVANTGGSGFVGVAHIEGYQKLANVVAAASTN